MRLKQRRAFTLIEVAMSIAILSFGLTAILVVYLTSLRWAEEIRIDMTSLHTARAAIYDAGVLADENDVSLGLTNTDSPAEGWVNGYYIIRTYTEEPWSSAGLSSLGKYVDVNVKVYYGGDNLRGRLVQDVYCEQFLLSGYNP